MGKTYDIDGVGIVKLSDFQNLVGNMSSSKLKSLSNQSLPDPIMSVIKDELNKRGKKDGGMVDKPLGAGGPPVLRPKPKPGRELTEEYLKKLKKKK